MSRRNFEATLERAGDRLNWTVIHVPFDVARVWGKRGQLRVKGSINGFAFRSSLFPDGSGHHYLMVNKEMQKGAGAVAGSLARFEMEPDTSARVIDVPRELTSALNEERSVRKFYDKLNHSTRREIARWVSLGKQPATRVRRATQVAERLMHVMEAEMELPPMLQLPLKRNPKARRGWDLMPPSHKRAHLFGIFHYSQPESRARRIAKAVDEMIAYAEKTGGKTTRRGSGTAD